MKGIYKITSPTGKVYIGQAYDIHIRWSREYEKYKCKKQVKLYNSLKKYGVENHKFEVMQIVNEDIEQKYLNLSEQIFAIMELDKGNELLNIRQPGGSKGRLSKETKKKIGDANRGRKRTEEQKARMRIVNVMPEKNQKWKESVEAALVGNKYALGYKHTEEWKREASKRHRKYDKIIQSQNGIDIREWESVKAIKDELNIYHVRECINGKRKSAGDYNFRKG